MANEANRCRVYCVDRLSDGGAMRPGATSHAGIRNAHPDAEHRSDDRGFTHCDDFSSPGSDRGRHPDQPAVPCGHADRYGHACADCDSDCDTDGNSSADADCDSGCDADGNSNADADCHPDCDADGNSSADADCHPGANNWTDG